MKKSMPYITVISIIIIMAGIMGMSEFSDNNKEIVSENKNNNNQETIVLDYPYYMLNSKPIYDDIEFQKQYPDAYTDYIRFNGKPDYLYNDFVVPEKNLTHQNIANICGETIEYLYGRSDLQNNKAAVMFINGGANHNNELMAVYRYKDEFFMFLDTLSGEIKHFECKNKGTSIKPNRPGTSDYETDFFTDKVKTDMAHIICESVFIFNQDFEIANIEYCSDTSFMHNGMYYLTTKATDKNNNSVELGFYTNDFVNYELSHFHNVFNNTNNAEIKQNELSVDIYKCDDVYRSEWTMTHGKGTIVLSAEQDILVISDYKIILCEDKCDPTDVVNRAFRGYAPAWKIENYEEYTTEEGWNYNTRKYLNEVPEEIKKQMISQEVPDSMINPRTYIYLLTLDDTHYAYIELESIDYTESTVSEHILADSIIKSSVINLSLDETVA